VTDTTKNCDCADFVANGGTCNHVDPVTIYKVDYPKTDLVEPQPAKKPKKKKKTYPQDWAPYTAAQTNEKTNFMRLLAGLCEFVEHEAASGPGRPRNALPDIVFLIVYKVYEQLSTRRFMSDARIAQRSGFIREVPHFNSIINGMNDERLTNVLHMLIEISSLPFRGLEQTFAADSSGFAASPYDRWQELKPGGDPEDGADTPKRKKKRKKEDGEVDAEEYTNKERKIWAKVHVLCGTDSHIVCAAVIKDRNASDPRQLPELIEKTSSNFAIKQLCADKAYGSIANYQVCAAYGIDPFIPFKSNQTGAGNGRSGQEHKTAGGALWRKKFVEFHYHSEAFEAHYHKRSNVETVFSMIKKLFGSAVRSKSERGMLNEVLCKIVCHNICCINHATFALGLDVDHLHPTRPRVPNLQVIEGGLGRREELRPV
jgi:hypothetical protein